MQPRKRGPFSDISNILGAQQTVSLSKSRYPHRSTAPVVVTEEASSSPPSPRYDESHRNEHLHVHELVKTIYENLRKAERVGRPSANYMSVTQTDVNEKMRTILNDWLVDVHLKFKLLPETLFRAVEIIDRFLDKKVVSRQKLQLVGVVAMLLAAKYEEIYPPEVKDFIYIAANTYTREDILRMERVMFATLEFSITFPTIYPFLKRALQVIDADSRKHHLAQCLAELCLMDYKMLQYPPSLIGTTCVYLANKFLGVPEPWVHNLEYYCQYSLADVERCAVEINSICQNAPNQKTQAVRKKYSYPKFGEVTKLLPGL